MQWRGLSTDFLVELNSLSFMPLQVVKAGGESTGTSSAVWVLQSSETVEAVASRKAMAMIE
eukprot:2810103-Amphidinium_carterae.1